MTDARVLIVGAGLAGSRCAETLRALGHDGDVVLVGDEPCPPYERPALSKQLLDGSRAEIALRDRAFWRARGIDLRTGTRVLDLGLESRVATTSGGEVGWDALVIATGARPRVLPTLARRDGVHVLRTLADAEALRPKLVPGARLAIVGAGFIGAEVASTATRLGVHVSLLEAGPVPLERVLGPEVGALLAERYRDHGVDLRVGAPVERILSGGRGRTHTLELAGGDTIACDVVLAAAGSVPAAELAGDEALASDGHGRTALPGVYACGDVVAWWRHSLGRHVRSEHWTSAAAQAATVARSVLGGGDPLDQPGYFWSDQFGLRLQHIGDDEPWTDVSLEGNPDAFTVSYRSQDGRLVGALLANEPGRVAELRRELDAARAA